MRSRTEVATSSVASTFPSRTNQGMSVPLATAVATTALAVPSYTLNRISITSPSSTT